ncbi:hypothetical protein ACQE3E_00460 [Methylomonas sp. MED-D]|uniref:hypothetical protein n=1 Tax=unclassified Methylomonas TaxID=2608980 RepID=UPI002478E881|nr:MULTISPECIES: hypothetical protein [unclassified Methylomonas]MDT4330621.1 hypothetical protein [Methylomonas sp. MV1]WGS86250.1 hypothetical protein QC632_00465 [Methylomonas sp. UP202]
MKIFNKHGFGLTAVCMVLGMGSAQAAINPGTQAQQTSGEMFLSVYDVDNATTYGIDLATTVNDFTDNIANGTSYTWNLGPRWANFIANATGELQWNVLGSNYYTAVSLLDPHYGILVSQTNISDLREADKLLVQVSQLQGQTTGVKNQALALNQALPNSTPIVTPGKTKLTDYAANWDLTTTNSNAFSEEGGIGLFQASAYLYADGTEHTNFFGENDETVRMLFWHTGSTPGTTTNSQANFDFMPGYMSLDIASGTLNWNYVTAVPLPGAAWMFLGGLLSLLRFTNRSRQSVQA